MKASAPLTTEMPQRNPELENEVRTADIKSQPIVITIINQGIYLLEIRRGESREKNRLFHRS